MRDIKISFIVPVYNAEKYIEKCVTSMIEQTYKNNEIILVDDGSVDNSNGIINNLAKKFPNIKVIEQQNCGPSKARNKGLDAATGDYIAFVDADDYLDESFSLEMIEKSESGLADLVVCNYIEVNNIIENKINIFKRLDESNEACLNEVIAGPGGLVWGKLFKRKIIIDNKIRFDEDYRMCEDLLFCIEFAINIKKVGQTSSYLYIYNKCNEGSITSKYTSEMFFLQLDIQDRIENLLRCSNLYNINRKNIMVDRMKNILQYSLYKECVNKEHKKISEKVKYIDFIIRDKRVEKVSKEFNFNGPIDRAIVGAIKLQKPIKIYFFTNIRRGMVYCYSKTKKILGGN